MNSPKFWSSPDIRRYTSASIGITNGSGTRFPLLTSRQQARLTTVFADDAHLAVQVTWSVYQRIIAYVADRGNGLLLKLPPK